MGSIPGQHRGNTASAASTASQGAGRRSQGRSDGTASSQISTAGASSTAVYLLVIASPAATPTIPHQPARPVASTRPRPNRAAVQKKISGVSGVIMTEPAPNSRVALASTAATTPALRPGSRSSAARQSSTDPTAVASGPSRRTPKAVSPSRAVPARIHRATMGGWSRYPGARARDQAQ